MQTAWYFSGQSATWKNLVTDNEEKSSFLNMNSSVFIADPVSPNNHMALSLFLIAEGGWSGAGV